VQQQRAENVRPMLFDEIDHEALALLVIPRFRRIGDEAHLLGARFL
jgi:hypothetical protein